MALAFAHCTMTRLYSAFHTARHTLYATSAFLSASVLLSNIERSPVRTEETSDIDQSSSKADPSKLFYGQCWKRQLHRPNLPYPAWDYNWDGRMTESTTQQAVSHLPGFQNSKQGITRHILLIRHGQYDEESSHDEKRVLTPLGRRQAAYTGQRLALLANVSDNSTDNQNLSCHLSGIHVSDMTRAKETAKIIASYLSPDITIFEPDPLLNEALPSPTIPLRPDIPNAEEEIDANHARIEEAFQKYVYRAADYNENDTSSSSSRHEFTIIVGHGNVIRYFLCRALQLPPEAWLRFSTFNCSITYLQIAPNGYVSARLVGDTGHIPYEETTFSSYHGYNF